MDYASLKQQGRVSYNQVKDGDSLKQQAGVSYNQVKNGDRISYSALKKTDLVEHEETISYEELKGTQKNSPPRRYSNPEHKLEIAEGKLAIARARLKNKARNGSKEFPNVRRLKSNDLQNRAIEECLFKRFSYLKKSKKGIQNQRVLYERTVDIYPLAVELGYSNQVRVFCDHLPKHYEQPSNKADYFTAC